MPKKTRRRLAATVACAAAAVTVYNWERGSSQFAATPSGHSPAATDTSRSGGSLTPRPQPGAAAPKAQKQPAPSGVESPNSFRGALPLASIAGLALLAQRAKVSCGAATATAGAATKAKRIDAFDSMRFVLISYIVCGHFIGFAKLPPVAYKLLSQINVVVGAFFALSGYVAAYTRCEIGQRKLKDKAAAQPAMQFIVSRIFGYWPLHMLVLALFSYMFVGVDVHFNGALAAAWHGFLSVTMCQAWFPMHAEVWNAPTWFLSALTFSQILTPYFLPILAGQTKPQLRRTAMWLTFFCAMMRLGYSYDTGSWGLMEGSVSGKLVPNLALFNALRFSPICASLEVMLGAVACRLVQLDGSEGEPEVKASLLDTVGPLVGMLAILALRAFDVVALGDLLTRSFVFMPLFMLFLMGLHRASLPDKVTDPLANILNWKPFVWLGGLSFPIFVVHGPIGQVFYKKIVATHLFGAPMHVKFGPWFFYVYLAIVGVAAYLLKRLFMDSKAVAKWSSNTQAKILKYV
eukprot:TRINITY_DN40310_c0_g1_i1.p1 TRINITY_DN40310_c0_g1~~TRINITY_DN40310_c0_g1_i1.p1  ORF type:complete len:518 (+),score=119.73 TRINITY_DN40310_c0_g1_i1:82-1635(+)